MINCKVCGREGQHTVPEPLCPRCWFWANLIEVLHSDEFRAYLCAMDIVPLAHILRHAVWYGTESAQPLGTKAAPFHLRVTHSLEY